MWLWNRHETYCNFCTITHPLRAKRFVQVSVFKKAMLIFYEQNNLHAFKQIFLEQYAFAVREYF